MQIITNNKPRNITFGFELTDQEKKEFDYIQNIDDAQFFRYKGQVYDLGEFMRIDPNTAPHPHRKDWEKWQGYMSDSYFSGLLVKYTHECESVIVARYSC